MLKRKALRKMLITTVTVFILLIVYLIPTKEKEKTLNTNLEVEYVTGVGTHNIYLLNQNQYLVKSKILLSSDQLEEQVKQLVETLVVGKNSKTPTGLDGVLPEKTKLLGLEVTKQVVTLNFSKDILKVEMKLEERMVESLVYSLLDLEDLKGVILQVEGEPLTALPHSKKSLPTVLTKEFGINKVYDIENRNGINKVTVYYLEEFDENYYYVPVTKYVNDSRDKIKIIIDNLTSNYIYEPNLMSFLNEDVKLLDYKQEDQLMILNFNDAIFTDQDKILEEVVYSIAYSVFENYDVNEVVLRVDEKDVVKRTMKEVMEK